MLIIIGSTFSYHKKTCKCLKYIIFVGNCRTVWFILFFISLVGFLFVFARGVIQYRSYPVATKTEYHTSSHIQFPSVTLCNRNFIRKSFIGAQTTPGLHKAIRSLNPLIESTERVVFDAQDIESMKSVNITNMDTAGAHQMHDMFTRCSFRSRNATLLPCRLYHLN